MRSAAVIGRCLAGRAETASVPMILLRISETDLLVDTEADLNFRRIRLSYEPACKSLEPSRRILSKDCIFLKDSPENDAFEDENVEPFRWS
jgi:hypothetical protein